MESMNLYQHQLLIQQQQLAAAAAGYPLFNWNPSISTSEEEYYNYYSYYKGKEELWKRNIDTFSSTKTQIIQDSHQIKDMNGLKDNYLKEYDFDLNENFMSQDHSYMNNAKTCYNNGFYGNYSNNYMSSHREYSNFQDPNFSFNGLMYKNSTSIIGMQQVMQSPPEKRPAVSNNTGDSSTAKRLNYPAEALSQEPSKKPRVTSQSSTTLMLKQVRKEKLGDRISALHRLVAPFGKTDTASVLTEAIGYIQFLQDQIQKLSIPYTKSSHEGTLHQINLMDSSIDMKAVVDLKKRGLCLVPISLSSYITTTSCDGNNI